MALISVIMPNHNGSAYIGEAIASVRAQTHQAWELWVVDDASTDQSPDLIRQIAAQDARIRPLLLERNIGAANARNRALERAEGQYVAFLDSDDVWLPQKLEAQLALMRKNDAAISFTSFETISPSGAVQTRDVCKAPYFTYAHLLGHHRMMTSSIMIDQHQIHAPLRFPERKRREDYFLWMSLLRGGVKAYGTEQILLRYRHVPASKSANKLRCAKDVWECMRRQEKLPLAVSAWHFLRYVLGNLTRRRQWKRLLGGG